MREKKLALVGNPNVGKSSLFNQLTGLKQRIGNYPGTTIEKRIGFFTHKKHKIKLYDYPGTYTLYPKSVDEQIVFDILSNPNHPDFPEEVLVVAHPLRLNRSILLLRQVQSLGFKTGLVINMIDELEKENYSIDFGKLEDLVQSKVIKTNARNGFGLKELKNNVIEGFDTANVNFSTPQMYASAVSKIKSIFDLDNEYIAWQYLAQPEIFHFKKAQNKEIDAVRKEYKIVPARLQINETINWYKEIGEKLIEIVHPPEEEKTSITEKLDKILTHPILGYLIFFLILLFVFQAIYSWANVPMDFIDTSFANLQTWVSSTFPEGPLSSLLADGIIPGIGGVIIFVPQIAILITFLLLLEESGYISRVVFLMDKWMKPFGLNGKSVVPLLSGVACAIPGIMAARNIENNRERLITMLVTPFITCSARLPVYAILIALIIPQQKFLGLEVQGLVLMGLYLIGLLAAMFFSFFLKLSIKAKYKSYLIMEMPDYRVPQLKNILIGIKEKVFAFIFGAGKIILAVSIILWVMSSWSPTDEFKHAEEIVAKESSVNNWTEQEKANHLESFKLENSLLGNFGKLIEPVFRPLGYDWKISIGVLTSFAAREVFVGTLATIYSMGSDNDDENQIIGRMHKETRADGSPVYTFATGISLLLFYAFAMQCMSTLAIVKRETHTWKWAIIQLVFMSGFAYLVSLIAYTSLS